MKTEILQYIEEHKLAWSETTQRSERFRLLGVMEALTGNPDFLWTFLNRYKPYTRNTIWVRVVDFWNWKMKGNSNPYADWKAKNARLFKHTYQRQTPKISIEEAKVRIAKLQDPAIQRKALELLYSGLRFSESNTLVNGHSVVGKGGKIRDAFLPSLIGPDYKASYWKFWKALNTVGLKPHDLRKIRATELLRQGMDVISVCEAMGWSKVDTATCYLAPLKREQMAKFFKGET